MKRLAQIDGKERDAEDEQDAIRPDSPEINGHEPPQDDSHGQRSEDPEEMSNWRLRYDIELI